MATWAPVGVIAVPMAAGHPFNEAMEPQATEVVRHRSRGVGVRLSGLELRDVIAELPMPEAGGGKREETERVHECVDPSVAEAEARRPLIVHEDGRRDSVQAVFPDQAVVAQRFDV